MQLCGSLSIIWHCLSLGLEGKLTFSSPVATAEFSKFASILSAALSQHHLSGFGIAHSLLEISLWSYFMLRRIPNNPGMCVLHMLSHFILKPALSVNQSWVLWAPEKFKENPLCSKLASQRMMGLWEEPGPLDPKGCSLHLHTRSHLFPVCKTKLVHLTLAGNKYLMSSHSRPEIPSLL